MTSKAGDFYTISHRSDTLVTLQSGESLLLSNLSYSDKCFNLLSHFLLLKQKLKIDYSVDKVQIFSESEKKDLRLEDFGG